MHTFLTCLFLVLGFVFLVKGADWLVSGSSSVARLLRVPSIVIGLTIVAFGTSAPELAVSVTAALSGSNDIAIGNVVGSNFFNLLMVVGICSLIKPMKIQQGILRNEFPLSIICGILLLVLSLDFGNGRILGRTDGIIFLLIFIFYVTQQVTHALKSKKAADQSAAKNTGMQTAGDDHPDGEPSPDSEAPGEEIKVMSPAASILLILIGLALVTLGGKIVVECATSIARTLGLSEAFIGLTIVAFGTSLPELMTSIVASHKGENDLALGNVIGSNIFNILLILGVSAAIHPMNVAFASIIDLIILTVVSVITLLMARHGREIGRGNGAVMVAMYVAYVGYLLSQI